MKAGLIINQENALYSSQRQRTLLEDFGVEKIYEDSFQIINNINNVKVVCIAGLQNQPTQDFQYFINLLRINGIQLTDIERKNED